jgi:hypothetical protein
MIVHIPGQHDSLDYFLDPTEKFQPFRRAPISLQGKNVLILDSSKPRLTSVPEIINPREHSVKIKHYLSVDKTMLAEGLDSLIITGKLAAEFRSQIAKWDEHGKLETIISWITQGYSGYQDGKLTLVNETKIDKPLMFIFSFNQQLSQQDLSDGLTVQAKLEKSFLRYPKAENRKTPIYFPFPIQISSQWHFNFPENYIVKINREDQSKSENNFSWKFSASPSNPYTWYFQQQWQLQAFLAQAEEYKEIKSGWDEILDKASFQLKIN